MNAIKTVTVAGAGTMGRGIAQAIAQGGFATILYDVNAAAVDYARSEITVALSQLADKQKITREAASQALSQIVFTTDINDCRCDLVIEAVIEQIDMKQKLFTALSSVNTTDCIFATNTSSLSVTEIASGIEHPERVAGLHFFNPATVMKLVELVRTPATSEHVLNTLQLFIQALGKTCVSCNDAPGFIVNHVARPYYIEALRLMEQGVEIELIDRIMEATGFRMGPFKLMDLIGNDINYAVSLSVYEALGQPSRLLPSGIQKELVETGRLGRKSKQGFYSY